MHHDASCALALSKGLKLLDERGLPVTRVTANDYQPKFTFKQCGLELLVQVGWHIGGLTNLIQARVPALETLLWL